ncbi:unnamed protein product [Parajaminaea phylloscopi]
MLFKAIVAATCAAFAAQHSSVAASQVPFGYDTTPFGQPFSLSAQASYLEPTITIELPLKAASSRLLGTTLSIEQLIAAQNGSFARLVHQDFPGAGIRIKRHAPRSEKKHLREDQVDDDAFCDPTVASWTGYIDTVDGKSLFFFFFESRNSPSDDPLILWTNGGPGASGALGLFMELGPCRVAYPEKRDGPPINRTDYFAYSWNDRANVIFIEQPASEKHSGVGYSYRRFGTPVSTTAQASVDVYHFLRIFLSAFERFHGNELHLAGESYGGRYIPQFATEVADRNHKIREDARRKQTDVDPKALINLKSIIIGNGIVDLYDQMLTEHAFACTRQGGYGPPKFDIKSCERRHFWTQRCARTLKHNCRDNYEDNACAAEVSACERVLGAQAWIAAGYNVYDVSDDCRDGMEVLCYGITAAIEAYLNSDDVRELIGAAPRSQTGNYTTVSDRVNEDFDKTHDLVVDGKPFVSGLVERGIDALIYAGELDAACHWLGNLAWVSNLEYTGKVDFRKSLKPWYVDGHEVGKAARGGGLTFATVAGAGHMVPYKEENAKVALAMIHRWTAGEDLQTGPTSHEA